MGSILIDELQGVVSHQITPQGDTAGHLQLKMFRSECAIIHPDLICLSDFHMFTFGFQCEGNHQLPISNVSDAGSVGKVYSEYEGPTLLFSTAVKAGHCNACL